MQEPAVAKSPSSFTNSRNFIRPSGVKHVFVSTSPMTVFCIAVRFAQFISRLRWRATVIVVRSVRALPVFLYLAIPSHFELSDRRIRSKTLKRNFAGLCLPVGTAFFHLPFDIRHYRTVSHAAAARFHLGAVYHRKSSLGELDLACLWLWRWGYVGQGEVTWSCGNPFK